MSFPFFQRSPGDNGMHTHEDVKIVQHVGCNHSSQTWVLKGFPEPACPAVKMVQQDKKRFNFYFTVSRLRGKLDK